MKINRRFSKTGSGQSHLHNAIFEPFMYKKDHFAKTGSGQNIGKALRLRQRAFFAPPQLLSVCVSHSVVLPLRKSSAVAPCRKHISFCERFLIFVPSLSWQKEDHF